MAATHQTLALRSDTEIGNCNERIPEAVDRQVTRVPLSALQTGCCPPLRMIPRAREFGVILFNAGAVAHSPALKRITQIAPKGNHPRGGPTPSICRGGTALRSRPWDLGHSDPRCLLRHAVVVQHFGGAVEAAGRGEYGAGALCS